MEVFSSPDTTETWIPPESPIGCGFTSIAPTPLYRFMLVSEAAGLLPELFPTSSVTPKSSQTGKSYTVPQLAVPTSQPTGVNVYLTEEANANILHSS